MLIYIIIVIFKSKFYINYEECKWCTRLHRLRWISRFILTMRNVNHSGTDFGVPEGTRFILTMRNVNKQV